MENLKKRRISTPLKEDFEFIENKLEKSKIKDYKNDEDQTAKPKEKFDCEKSTICKPVSIFEKQKKWFRIHCEIDLLSISLFLLALLTRMYKLEEPKNIV